MAELTPFPDAHLTTDFGELDPAWDGVRVEWRELAGTRARLLWRDGNPDGPLVVLVHGLGGTATNWLECMAGFSTIGDVVAVDLQGFGETAPPRPHSSRPRSNARFVATLLHALDRGPAVLVGNSMGGLVSTIVAAEHPGLVSELVLLGPALPPKLVGLRPSKHQITSFGPLLVPVVGTAILRRRILRMSWVEQARYAYSGIVADPDALLDRTIRLSAANISRLKELRWRGPAFREATTAITDLLVGRNRPALLRMIDQVQAPTLYLRGTEDALVLAATTRLVRDRRPDWTIEEPDGLGHVLQVEAPEFLVERVSTWLEGAEVRSLQRA